MTHRLQYDPTVDALWVELRPRGRSARTVRVSRTVAADFDADGRLLGVEVLDASWHLSSTVLREARAAKASKKTSHRKAAK
jgi:uncharacterized protein YuzE